MLSFQLSNMEEKHLVRGILMERVHQEKYIQVIGELQSKLAMAQESIALLQEKVRTLM